MVVFKDLICIIENYRFLSMERTSRNHRLILISDINQHEEIRTLRARQVEDCTTALWFEY